MSITVQCIMKFEATSKYDPDSVVIMTLFDKCWAAQALQHCEESLALNPTPKAHFRKGLALQVGCTKALDTQTSNFFQAYPLRDLSHVFHLLTEASSLRSILVGGGSYLLHTCR